MTPADWAPIIAALITAGLLKLTIDAVRWIVRRYKAGSPESQHSRTIETVDQSLDVVAKARDELEADNALLRALLVEERAAHTADRREWEAREATYRAEIDKLEEKVREILAELEGLKRRHS